MNFCARRFNLYLLPILLVTLGAGCATDKKNDRLAVLRVHIESLADTPEGGKTVSVLRDKPVLVAVSADPVLTEANVAGAALLETPGGFAVEVSFNTTGSLMLEQYTAANPGRHFVIFGQWGEKLKKARWLAAPIITHRVGNGQLAFTPDADRAEMVEFVLGLNNDAKKNIAAALK